MQFQSDNIYFALKNDIVGLYLCYWVFLVYSAFIEAKFCIILIVLLQDDKRKMVASAFGEDQSGGSGNRLTVEDLRFLFMGKQ